MNNHFIRDNALAGLYNKSKVFLTFGEKKYGKVLIKSIIAAFVIEITGAAVNLFSYFVYGKFLLAKQLYGGEWMG